MATRIDPNKKKLLEDFITYLERWEDVNGWVIVNKTDYEQGKNNVPKQRKKRPPVSKRGYIRFFLAWKEMEQKDLDFEIDRFLSKVNE